MAVTALIAAGLIPALRPLLLRHALAHPNARSAHTATTPQGGGIAVMAAVIAVSAAVWFSCKSANDPGVSFWIAMIAGGFLAAVGMADDVRAIPVVPRLALQSVAVGAVILALPRDLDIIAVIPDTAERMLLFLGGLWFVNLVNFMDGIDWMTVAAFVPICAGLAGLGFLGALPPAGTFVTLALLGALIGFAPFNRPVARLFLGDAGSLPLGLLVGWLLVLLAGSGHLAAALLLPLYYLADATLTLFRRLLNGERIWEAHRTHYYQRAAAGGFSVTEIVTRVFAINIALAVLAATTVIFPSVPVTLTALVLGAALVGWLLASFASGRR